MNWQDLQKGFNPGVYNIDYFCGAQMAAYIGDIWIDEITSMSFSISHNKIPIYGYSDTLFRTVSKGQVLVQGQFTINFKEAGYLWLVLNRYHQLKGTSVPLYPTPKNQQNIEQAYGVSKVLGNQITKNDKNKLLNAMQEYYSLAGDTHADGGKADALFTLFENGVWGKKTGESLADSVARRCDDPSLNNFDIYLSYGDFLGDAKHNHTMQRLTNIHIIGSGQAIEISGMPLQESYQFIGRNKL